MQNSTPGAFPSTVWSVALRAGSAESGEARSALERLCRAYWYPLYTFIRQRGNPPADAEDLTQGFLAHVLEKHALDRVGPERGRFRTFLLASLKNFLANEWDRKNAIKRGGGRRVVSLSRELAESRYRSEPSHDMTPERRFEREWALTVLEQALGRLEEEYRSAGQGTLFDSLKPSLTGGGESYSDIAKRLGNTEGAVKVAAHRLRRRYRERLRELIAETVGEEDVADELNLLLAALAAS